MEELGAFSEKDFKNDEINKVMKKLDERVWKKLIIKLKAEGIIRDEYLVTRPQRRLPRQKSTSIVRIGTHEA